MALCPSDAFWGRLARQLAIGARLAEVAPELVAWAEGGKVGPEPYVELRHQAEVLRLRRELEQLADGE